MPRKPLRPPSTSSDPVRVLIVDDHPMMREGLSAVLSLQPDMIACGAAANIDEALTLVRETVPQVAVIGISLNNENGLELVRKLKADHSSLLMLILSMYDDELYAERALEAGAMGYLNKHVDSLDVVLAIRRILSGQRYLSDEMASKMTSKSTDSVPRNQAHGVSSLTDRELEVLKMIGSGLLTAEIANKLFVSVKTVQTHRHNIKLKLGLETAAQLSREATRFFMENT